MTVPGGIPVTRARRYKPEDPSRSVIAGRFRRTARTRSWPETARRGGRRQQRQTGHGSPVKLRQEAKGNTLSMERRVMKKSGDNSDEAKTIQTAVQTPSE